MKSTRKKKPVAATRVHPEDQGLIVQPAGRPLLVVEHGVLQPERGPDGDVARRSEWHQFGARLRQALFAAVAGFGGFGAPPGVRGFNGESPAVSPRHGAYAGAIDLYNCQPPLCREPQAQVKGLTALQ